MSFTYLYFELLKGVNDNSNSLLLSVGTRQRVDHIGHVSIVLDEIGLRDLERVHLVLLLPLECWQLLVLLPVLLRDGLALVPPRLLDLVVLVGLQLELLHVLLLVLTGQLLLRLFVGLHLAQQPVHQLQVQRRPVLLTQPDVLLDLLHLVRQVAVHFHLLLLLLLVLHLLLQLPQLLSHLLVREVQLALLFRVDVVPPNQNQPSPSPYCFFSFYCTYS